MHCTTEINSCNTRLHHTIAIHCCNALLQHTAATHCCTTLLQCTAATHYYDSSNPTSRTCMYVCVRVCACVCVYVCVRVCVSVIVCVRLRLRACVCMSVSVSALVCAYIRSRKYRVPSFFLSLSLSLPLAPLPVCLFVWWVNKPRAVKPLRRFHSRRLSFTQDGPAFSTKTARRALQFQLRSALSKS